MRDDVLRFPDLLVPGPVEPVGHSMGGVVAYLLAQDRPRRVSRLVLEDVSAPRPRERTTPVRPDGDPAFDRDAVPAVRGQIDAPDPGRLERLGEITAETLVVAGGPGSHVPRDGVAEPARRVPHGRVVTIPVGHPVHRAAPEAFTGAVSAFLRVEGGTRAAHRYRDGARADC